MNKKDSNQKDKNVPSVEELIQKINDLENNWKRALADYKNLQRRIIDERDGAIKFSNYVLISEIIPVYDNLKMVEKHSDDSGLKMVVAQFEEVLKAVGVEKVKAEGEDFDESVMEAIETREGEPGKVLEVLQNGYKFREKLIKPARVVVGENVKKAKDNPGKPTTEPE